LGQGDRTEDGVFQGNAAHDHDDDHATCVAYVRASHHNPNSTGDSDQTVYGYYTNRFERTSSGWRIARVKLTALWMTGNFGIFQTALDHEADPAVTAELEPGN